MVAYVDHTAALSPGTGGVLTGTAQISLPTHAAGDRFVLYVTGKPPTTAIPTINQGWSLVASGTGGTGTTGVDAGPTYWAIYAKDAASSSETAPTLTFGSPATNVTIWECIAYRPGAGNTWADSIANLQVVSGSDTTTAASPLTATTGAFTNQPTAGDAIAIFGTTPTDSTIHTTATATATGLSGGTVASATGTTVTGNDCCYCYGDWTNFTGTASSGITITFNFSAGSNTSGPLVAVALRQRAPMALGQVTETDTAQSLTVTAGTVMTLGQASETDSARPLTVNATVPLGQVTETDTALPVTLTNLTPTTLSLTQAVETDTAHALSMAVVIPLGLATETDTALSLTILAGALVQLAQATETDTAFALHTVIVLNLGQVEETDTAFALIIIEAGPVSADTATSNSVYALMFTGDADVIWEPPITPRPAHLSTGEQVVKARTIDDVDLSEVGFATLDETVKQIPRHRDRIVIGNVDWTYRHGVRVETPDYELLEPGMYGSGGTLLLPQINARYERLGINRLKRVRLGTTVKYQRVDETDPDNLVVVATDYKGLVLRQGRRGDALSLDIGGELLGRAANKWRPAPIFRKLREAALQIGNVIRGMGLRYVLNATGIDLPSRGGMYEDQWLLDSTGQLTTGDGDQWTVMPGESGAYTMVLKDRETVNATVYFDNQFATDDLGDDLAEKPNRVWINAVAPDGHRIMHATAPLVEGMPVPEFPTVEGGPMVVGNTDDQTSTGNGVTQLLWRLTFAGLLDREDHGGGFDEDAADAVRDFQRSAGIGVLTGAVTEATWDALWDNNVVGYSIQYAAQRPAVEDDAVQKFDRSGSGAILGHHEGYDEDAIVVDLPLDMGMVGSRRRAFKMARHKLHPVGQADWVGTITLTSGLIEGEHNPGDPFTADMVIPNRAVRPGWNIWEPWFDDGTLFHVVACKVRDQGRTVDVVVDTRARDAMEAWQVHQRNRENRYQPSRYLGGPRRRSTAVQDTVSPWDKIVGQTDRSWPLAEGWTAIPVPAGQVGTIKETNVVLGAPDEFAAMFTHRRPPIDRLNRKVPDPLATPDPDPQSHHIALTGEPTGGTFTLAGNGNLTGEIAYDATAAQVQAEVRTLGGLFASANVSGSHGTYDVVMPTGEADLAADTNSLTGGTDPDISIQTTGPTLVPGMPWYEKPAIRRWLKPYGVPIAWGTGEQPCGYDPRTKTNAQTGLPTGAPMTGEFFDDSSWGFDCGVDGAELFLLIWLPGPNTLPKQRVLTIQLDGSGV